MRTSRRLCRLYTAVRSRGAWLAGTLALFPFLANTLAQAANINTPAIPITSTLTVQPIVVCQGSGGVSSTPGIGCAPNGGLGAYETYANDIYDQAGIGIAFAPPEYLDNAAYLNVQSDTSANSAFDTSHNLMRLPGDGQSADADTLNVYLVDTITSTTNGVPNGVGVYGTGLIGGNGAIIATAPDAQGRQAAVDTLAHELGHNLGLSHVDSPPLSGANAIYDTPYNLMNTGSRQIPTSPCQIPPYTCAATKVLPASAASARGASTLTLSNVMGITAGMVLIGPQFPNGDAVKSIAGKVVTLTAPLSGSVASGASVQFGPPETDQLAPFQIATVQAPPIFTELPYVQAYQDGSVDTTEAGAGMKLTLGPTATALETTKFRFTDPTTRMSEAFGSASNTAQLGATTTNVAIGSHTESDVIINPAAVGPGNLQLYFTWSGFLNGSTFNPPLAYSSEYDFGNGVTSRAGFDQTGYSQSQDGAVFTFDPTTPGLPSGASYLPTDYSDISPVTGRLVTEETDSAWSTPGEVDGTVLPFQVLDSAAAVPEPAGLLVLGTAMTGLLTLRRRRVRHER